MATTTENTSHRDDKRKVEEFSAEKKEESKDFIFVVLFAIVLIGILMIILGSLYSFVCLPEIHCASDYWYNFFTTIGMQFLLAGAAGMFGSFLGFVFGIPKYDITAGSKKNGAIAFSDNLVQVSDWLTKIIVGVGLTQLTKLPHYLKLFGQYIDDHSNVNPNTAIALLIYFVICGFAGGYLWTTIYYPPIMNDVYKAVTDPAVVNFVRETDNNREALRIINEQLARGIGQADIDSHLLIEAIAKLNDKDKDAIFQMVDRVFYENMGNNPNILRRIIPIFQALIKVGNEEQKFEYYGELGFLFMELSNLQEAYKALTEAMKLRPQTAKNYEQFEHNMAETLILMNTNKDDNYTIDESLKSRILEYLKIAIRNPRIEEHMNVPSVDNMVIRRWLATLDMNLEDLKRI